MRSPAYQHAQLFLTLWLLSPVSVVAAALVHQAGGTDWWVPALIIGVHAALLLLLGQLTIELDEHRIEWRFGYVGWPRWRLALADLSAVEVTQSNALEGWGIHRTRRGWLYNVSGRRAVELTMRDGRRLRLGSDEPERLAAFISARLPET